MVSGRPARAACAAALTCVAVLCGAPTVRAALLPPANPRYSLGIGRYLPNSCAGVRDFSSACMRESLGMLNAGRRSEGLGPLQLPANWQALTVAQQLFVLTELERTARGLPPDGGLSASLNGTAVGGADAGRDPSGGGVEALWAGGEPNAIVVIADWIYEDGLFAGGFSENLNCSAAAPAGCWQHRDILLHDGASGSCGRRCAVGAGYSPSGYGGVAGTGGGSYAEVFRQGGGGAQTFTWAAELEQMPACEQSGDSCGWSGSPVATTNGIETIATTNAHAPVTTRPWFATTVSSRLTARGGLSLRIHVGIRLFALSVVARRRARLVRLRVRRLPDGWYTATGRLPAGTWTLRIRYRTTRTSRRRPMSQMRVTVP